ncbi:MAG: abortive infection protein [Acidimicrobiales bacterium]
MKRRGIIYDVGTVFTGFGWKVKTRPRFELGVVQRELEIVRDDLHANAVRLRGRDVGRLVEAGRLALDAGLEVLLSPERFFTTAPDTVNYLTSAARAAESLRQRYPERVMLSVASEATLFVRGIVAGATIQGRMANLKQEIHTDRYAASLRAFLAAAVEAARREFHGPVTYAALPFEPVDWGTFDLVGVDHYRDARVKDRYEEMLQPWLATGKPVLVTEFGMRTYRGAASSGALGFGIADQRSVFWHQVPLLGRFVRRRLQPGDHVRDEAAQARELVETLSILDSAGVEGAFVGELVSPESPFDPDPTYDLDMSSFSLVRTLPGGGHGIRYPDMAWEPKEAFDAVGTFFAESGA